MSVQNFRSVIQTDADCHSDAKLAGRIASDLEHTGQTIGVADPMIAATAIGNALELVTGSTNHFERVRRVGYPLILAN